MHINAFVREIARMWLLITGGFRGRAIQRRHFWLQGSNGRCHGNQFLAKYITKSPQLQLYAPYPCRVWFCHRVCAVRELICDTPVHKGQRGVTMATNFGTKIAINAFLGDTTGMWLRITWVFRGRDVAMATKYFGQNRLKSCKIGADLSYVIFCHWYISHWNLVNW